MQNSIKFPCRNSAARYVHFAQSKCGILAEASLVKPLSERICALCKHFRFSDNRACFCIPTAHKHRHDGYPAAGYTHLNFHIDYGIINAWRLLYPLFECPRTFVRRGRTTRVSDNSAITLRSWQNHLHIYTQKIPR